MDDSAGINEVKSVEIKQAIPQDTTLEAFRYQVEVFRRLGREGRSRLMEAWCRGLRLTVEAGVRMRHPDYDDRQVKLAVIRLTAGDEVFRKLLPGVEIEV